MVVASPRAILLIAFPRFRWGEGKQEGMTFRVLGMNRLGFPFQGSHHLDLRPPEKKTEFPPLTGNSVNRMTFLGKLLKLLELLLFLVSRQKQLQVPHAVCDTQRARQQLRGLRFWQE